MFGRGVGLEGTVDMLCFEFGLGLGGVETGWGWWTTGKRVARMMLGCGTRGCLGAISEMALYVCCVGAV